ncbi:MAG: hypothetical protein V1910_02665 [bacterium]
MNKKYIEISEEKLNELEKQTKDKFTKKLIEDLKKQINSNELEMFKQFSFERIIGLIEHKVKRKELSEFKKNKYGNIAYGLKVSSENKRKYFLLNGNFLLSEFSEMIQKEFNLEQGHLYEFDIGNYKFGPECDEWQEVFDSLDDFKMGVAISVAGLNEGDVFKFIYDFGSNILFDIKLIEIKKLNLNF